MCATHVTSNMHPACSLQRFMWQSNLGQILLDFCLVVTGFPQRMRQSMWFQLVSSVDWVDRCLSSICNACTCRVQDRLLKMLQRIVCKVKLFFLTIEKLAASLWSAVLLWLCEATPSYSTLMTSDRIFFPGASERRVLPIVGVCISPSHLHTFSSSHLLSHLLIFTSSLTPSHLHIFSHTFSSSHLLSHLLIFTSSLTPSHLLSHLLIFTSSLPPSHLHTFSHTFSSSHLSHPLIFTSSLTPSHLHIFSHTFSSSHLLSHLLIFTSSLTPFSSSHLLSHPSHLHTLSHTFSSSHLLSLSFSLLSLFRPRVVPAVSHETSTLSHEMRVDRQKLKKNCDFTCAGQKLR